MSEKLSAFIEGYEFTFNNPDTPSGRLRTVWEIATTRLDPNGFDFERTETEFHVEFETNKETWKVSLVGASEKNEEMQKFGIEIERVEPLW